MLEKLGCLTELSALEMFIFSAFQGIYNSIYQRDLDFFSFFLDFDGGNSEITLQNGGFLDTHMLQQLSDS